MTPLRRRLETAAAIALFVGGFALIAALLVAAAELGGGWLYGALVALWAVAGMGPHRRPWPT